MNTQKNTPFPVTIITIFVLFITSWNVVRAYSAFLNWQVLTKYGASPAYILGTAILWAISGLWLLVIIRKKHNYALRANLMVAGLYYLWYWADQLIIQPSPSPNTIFSAIFSTILLLVFCISDISATARSFFGKE